MPTKSVKELTTAVMELEEEREKALKIEKFDEATGELHNLYKSFIKSGFTEEQAWELTKISLTNGTKKTLFKEEKEQWQESL